jgi:hypothetical protein
MLEKLLWADKTILKDNAKHQQPTPLCSTFARQKPRTSLAKELQNPRFCQHSVFQLGDRIKPIEQHLNPQHLCPPPPLNHNNNYDNNL